MKNLRFVYWDNYVINSDIPCHYRLGYHESDQPVVDAFIALGFVVQ
jgi:hypothetical protein